MSEDAAPYFAHREIEDLISRMRAAQTPSLKLDYARQLVAAKRALGGYQEIQGPMTSETVDALARHEAQASTVDARDPDQVGEPQ